MYTVSNFVHEVIANKLQYLRALEFHRHVLHKYCEAMKKLSLAILGLLAISLGLDRSYYRKYFEDGCSIMRFNNYPPCNQAGLTFGTGPHCDPNSITILHQDQVGGLEIFANNKWQAIRPRPDAFVVNIGDTFMVCSNLCFFLFLFFVNFSFIAHVTLM